MLCRAFDHVSRGKGKGCGIFSLLSRTLSQSKQTVSKEKYQIMAIIDKTNPYLSYQLVLLYVSSGCLYPELVWDLKKIIQRNMTAIVVGDFNFDHKETNEFTRYLEENSFKQVVNWPTHRDGRTIDQCYVSKGTRVQVTRHSPYYSDHDALVLEFENFPWHEGANMTCAF